MKSAKVKNFDVIIERDEDGWLISDVPELQGCHTQAKTMDQLIKRTKEVIQLCLEEQKEEEQDLKMEKEEFFKMIE